MNYPMYKAPDACALNPIPAEIDTTPGFALFIAATFSSAWWILQWFIYIENTENLVDMNNTNTVPIGWFWTMLGDRQNGWTAASYFSAFFVYGMTSVVEFVAWFFYTGGNTGLFGWWVSEIGWWGSVVGLALPWIFAVF